jgi:hypothetical protein
MNASPERPCDELNVIDDDGRPVVSSSMQDDPVAAVYGILDTGRSTDEILEELRGPST